MIIFSIQWHIGLDFSVFNKDEIFGACIAIGMHFHY